MLGATKKRKKILYVASGKKSFDYLLKKWSDDITYLDMCGSKGVIKANMLDMPFKDNEFDLVWCGSGRRRGERKDRERILGRKET